MASSGARPRPVHDPSTQPPGLRRAGPGLAGVLVQDMRAVSSLLWFLSAPSCKGNSAPPPAPALAQQDAVRSDLGQGLGRAQRGGCRRGGWVSLLWEQSRAWDMALPRPGLRTLQTPSMALTGLGSGLGVTPPIA